MVFGFILQLGVTAGLTALGVPFGVAALLGTFAMNIVTPAQKISGPRKEDVSVQRSEVGGDVPIVHGRYPILGHVGWVENDEIAEIAETSGGDDVGPFGVFGKTPEVTEYRYEGTYLTVLCESPQDGTGMAGYERIWTQNKPLIDNSSEILDLIESGSGSLLGFILGAIVGAERQFSKITFLDGNFNQKAPQRIIDDKGPITPGFQGVASIMIEDLRLEDYGNVIPATEVVVFEQNTDPYPKLESTLFANVDSNGANFHFSRNTGFITFASGSSAGQWNVMDINTGQHVYSGGPPSDPNGVTTGGNVGWGGSGPIFMDESLLTPDFGYDMGVVNNAGRLNKYDLKSGIIIDQFGTGELFPTTGQYSAFMVPRLSSTKLILGGTGGGLILGGEPGELFFYRKQLHMAHNTGKVMAVDPGPGAGTPALGITGLAMEYNANEVSGSGVFGGNDNIADCFMDEQGFMYVLHVEGGRVSLNRVWIKFALAELGIIPTLGAGQYTILGTDSFDLSSAFPTIASTADALHCYMTILHRDNTDTLPLVPAKGEILIYLSSDGTTDGYIAKFDTEFDTITGTEVGGTTTDGLIISTGGDIGETIYSGIDPGDGLIMFEGPGVTINQVDVPNWEVTYGIMGGVSYNDVTTWNASTLNSGFAYYSGDRSINGANPTLYEKLYLFRVDPNKIPLPTVITDILTRDSFIEASDLTFDATLSLPADNVDGYPETRTTSKRDKVGSLLTAHRVDTAFIDGKIHFRKRGGTIDKTLLQSDLGAGENVPAPLSLVETQLDETDLPNQVDVTFISPNFDDEFAQRTMHDKRHDDIVTTRHIDVFTTPELLTEDQATKLAYSLLTEFYVASQRMSVPLMPRELDTVATDRLNILANNKARTWRVLEGQLGAGTLINDISLARDDTNIYDPGVTGIPSNLTFPNSTFSGPSNLILLNLPMLIPNDGLGPTIHVALSPRLLNFVDETYPGASIWLSDDTGVTWDRILDVTTAPRIGHTIGTSPAGTNPQTSLEDHPRWWTLDRVNSFEVFWDTGDAPTTITEAQMMRGLNLAVVGNEVINFQTVVDNGNGSYTISNLLRGRFGTNDFVSSHIPGEYMVMLDSGTLGAFLYDLANVGVSRYYSAVTLGTTVSDPVPTIFTGTARNLEPISPYTFQRTRNVTTQDLNLSWLRRDRNCLAWDIDPGLEPVLSESVEQYRLTIYDPNDLSGATVLRDVIGLTTPAYTYTRADQIADNASRTIKDESQQLTVTNPGGEAGAEDPVTTGWTVTSGNWRSVIDTSGRPDPIEGTHIFEASSTLNQIDTMEQEIDLATQGVSTAAIDAEDVNLAMRFYVSKYSNGDDHTIQAKFRFKDVSKVEIQTVTGPLLLSESDIVPDK
jgi:hypothetical protein